MNNVKEYNSLPSIQLVENTEWQRVGLNGKEKLIPDEWMVKNVGESIDFKLGNTPPKTGSNYDGNTPWVTISNISGSLTTSFTAKIDYEKARVLPKGSLIGSFKMTVGRFSILGMDAATNEAIVGVSPDGAPGFSFDYLRFALVDPFVGGASTNGQGVQLLNTKTIKSLSFVAPPLPEQTLIAQVLTAQESQVHDLRKLAQAERQRLAWLSEELLSGRLRVEEDPTAESVVVSRNEKGEPAEVLPGVKVVENRGWKTVEVSGAEVSIPMDWDFQLVEHCARNISGATPPTGNPSYWGGELLWVTPGDMDDLDGAYIKDSNKKLTPAGYNLMGNRVVKPGSVVFSTRGSIGKVATNKEEIRISQSCEAFFFEDANPEFAVFYFRMIMDELKKKGAGTTFMSVTKKDIKELPFGRPSRNKQALIAQVLTAQETQVLEIERLADLEQQRFEWLSDELLSGRIRVKTIKED